ncbi:MAG: AraC family transcriptional regulator, partial [Deltaproteobacteria bacterium]|nr:AraC family transcriptional regulator [Deltaproteobacteria bacterium]
MASGVRIPHWLAQARHILDRDFRESLTTTQIARSVGVHPVYLAQVFRQYFGVGV